MTGPAHRSSPRTHAALDELGWLLLPEHTPPSVPQRIVDLVQQAVSGAADVSIAVVRDEHPTTAAFTGRQAVALDEIHSELTLAHPTRRPPPAPGA